MSRKRSRCLPRCSIKPLTIFVIAILIKELIKRSHIRIALSAGIIATIIALVVFTANWQLFDYLGQPLPGYQLLLWPGNLSLIYFWHPIFTEELAFWPKLALLLIGQLFIVTTMTMAITTMLVQLRKCYWR